MSQPPQEVTEADYGQSYADYLARRGSLRDWIRGFYLKRVVAMAGGPSVDLGCGAGALLARLPGGSIGLEVNEVVAAVCRSKGLDVRHFAPDEAIDRVLRREVDGRQSALCCLHVLEHLVDPAHYADRLLEIGPELGLTTMVFVVPGHKGFASDATHRTFIDRKFFVDVVVRRPGWRITHQSYFPFPSEPISRVFTHNELQTRMVFG